MREQLSATRGIGMRPKIGLALGGGAARGWSHIGVIRALEKEGIKPDVIAGTSIGALVGAAYASDFLDELEAWSLDLTWKGVIAMLDIRLSGGLIHARKVLEFLSAGMEGKRIEKMDIPFGCVATDLDDGHEVWMRRGDLLEAVRASIALPGLISPMHRDDRWLVDGGLVNPLPISLCRALGAEYVIAVDLNAKMLLPKTVPWREYETISDEDISIDPAETGIFSGLSGRISGLMEKVWSNEDTKEPSPSTIDTIFRSINIMSSRISRSRQAVEHADLVIVPDVMDIGLMEFHKAEEAITLGYNEAFKHREKLLDIKTKVASYGKTNKVANATEAGSDESKKA